MSLQDVTTEAPHGLEGYSSPGDVAVIEADRNGDDNSQLRKFVNPFDEFGDESDEDELWDTNDVDSNFRGRARSSSILESSEDTENEPGMKSSRSFSNFYRSWDGFNFSRASKTTTLPPALSWNGVENCSLHSDRHVPALSKKMLDIVNLQERSVRGMSRSSSIAEPATELEVLEAEEEARLAEEEKVRMSMNRGLSNELSVQSHQPNETSKGLTAKISLSNIVRRTLLSKGTTTNAQNRSSSSIELSTRKDSLRTTAKNANLDKSSGCDSSSDSSCTSSSDSQQVIQKDFATQEHWQQMNNPLQPKVSSTQQESSLNGQQLQSILESGSNPHIEPVPQQQRISLPGVQTNQANSDSSHLGNPAIVDCYIKILLLGDSGVGKTSLMTRFSENKFQNSFMSTTGVDYKVRYLKDICRKTVKCQVWDTAGQERFHVITRAYYKGAHGIALVYDVTDENSLKHVGYWMECIQEHANEDVKVVLVGNKVDSSKRTVTTEAGSLVADEFAIPHVECSALDGTNVVDTFVSLSTSVVESLSGSADDDKDCGTGLNTSASKRFKFRISKNRNKSWCVIL